ncbi:MAG: DUF1203 domain-containing protein [Porphyrobacter sp.]|nr:DUF1203 domain-containing protein [Porphyrobacter sp.]
MTYTIKGLPRARFAPLFELSDAELAAHNARRVIADADRGFPCRVSLEDATAGEALLLLNFVSNDGHTPYRTAHAIYVREGARDADVLIGETPPVFAGRPLSLRGFSAAGDLVAARLAGPDEHDRVIREMLDDPRVDHIDAHNAAHGCFSARIDRYMEAAQ